MTRQINDLPHVLDREDELEERLSGKHPAVFLDYDGTLTPIVDRPEDAVISNSMRDAVSGLAERCTVCVVSGRDRQVVQELMGLGQPGRRRQPRLRYLEPGRRHHRTRRRKRLRGVARRGKGPDTRGSRFHRRSFGRAKKSLRRRSLPAFFGKRAAGGQGERGPNPRRLPGRFEDDARQDGLRDTAKARLGQGQSSSVPAGDAGSGPGRGSADVPGRRPHRTSTPSRRWKTWASASSWGTPTTRRWGRGLHPQTIC